MPVDTAKDDADRATKVALSRTESRDYYHDYPVNITRTETFSHILEGYRKQLGDKRLFHSKQRSLIGIDLYEKSDAYGIFQKLDSLDKLTAHIDEEDGAPLWRIVSLASASSRGALCCSREQLTFLLTYYQVMPSFLDLVLLFKTRERPVLRTLFRHESYLDKDSPQALQGSKKSGMQIQHAFNLLSIEKANDPREKNQWPLRQVALYHSFDVANGRTLWIFLKGNQLMAKRFHDATKRRKLLSPLAITTPESSFAAALHVHAMVMDWCAESWGEYIEHLEDELSDISADANVASVENMITDKEMEHNFSRQGTFASVVTNQGSFGVQTPPSSPPSTPASPGRSFRRSSSGLATTIRRMSSLMGRQSGKLADEKLGDLESAIAEDPESEDDGKDHYADLDKRFAFQNFQQLNLLGNEVSQGLLAIEQNKGILQEIEEQYRAVIASYAFTTHMDVEACQGELSTFFRRIRGLNRDLDVHYCRLTALSQSLGNDKATLTALLQYKSERTAQYFANAAKISSERMEDWTVKMHTIAVRTEQETVSMHVITIFTLIFLPGTFIAVRFGWPCLQALLTGFQTFFSSGVFNWDDNGTLGSDWVVRTEGMKLFMSVCFPMMAIIVIAWIALNIFMNQRRRQKLEAVQADMESNQGLGLTQGKAATLDRSSNTLLATEQRGNVSSGS